MNYLNYVDILRMQDSVIINIYKYTPYQFFICYLLLHFSTEFYKVWFSGNLSLLNLVQKIRKNPDTFVIGLVGLIKLQELIQSHEFESNETKEINMKMKYFHTEISLKGVKSSTLIQKDQYNFCHYYANYPIKCIG